MQISQITKTHMMFDAITALLSLPRFCSHRPSRSTNAPSLYL